jgi:acetyl-CoA acetyltransferase
MRGKTVIAGIGHTKFGKLEGRTPVSMNVEACRKALADAGIEKGLVDAVFVKYPTSKFESKFGQTVAEALGIMPRIGGVWDQAGASGISMISFAAMAIEHGQCEVALVCMSDNPRTGTRSAYARPRGGADGSGTHGWVGTTAGYAMIARRHMGVFGTTEEQMAAVAINNRANGAKNPNAQLQLPISLDDYMQSRFIVEPLRRDDCCLISDGGAAVVVMSAAEAKKRGVAKPVPILGFGQGQTSWEVAQRPDLTATMAAKSGVTAFKMAGIAPKDIDVAQFYDCFTITPIMSLEDYGFCKHGQGGAFVGDGGIGWDGGLPFNTSGGLLSETGMPGMQLVIEGVRQMRGEANLQVAGAQKGIVSNQGGEMHTHSTLILGN